MLSLKSDHTDEYLVGVISDTHGLLRSDAIKALKDVELIIHAGDIGRPIVLENLKKIAPVAVVKGNMDCWGIPESLPPTEVLEIGENLIYVLHDLSDLDLDPASAGFRAVIFGHSHRPHVDEKDGVFYLNPGSAGPRRFDLPVSLARLYIKGKMMHAEFIDLTD